MQVMSGVETGSALIAILRVLGLWTLLLASFQIARVETAYGDDTDIIDLLSTGRIRTSATWCYKNPGPERCAVTMRIKDDYLTFEGVGCGSFRVPVNGSNGRQTAKISGNTISVSVTAKDGTGLNTYELSTDLNQCSYTVQCPAGFQAKVFSCAVERHTPTEALAQRRSAAKATQRKDEESPLAPARPARDALSDAHAQPSGSCSDITGAGGSVLNNCLLSNDVTDFQLPRVDAQSYMEAARDLKERDTTYNSFLAAVQTFRRAAAAFDAAGDIARARAATDEAQALENDIKIAERRVGLMETQNQCGILRGNALQCYARAARLQPSPSSEPIQVGRAGAFLDCVKTYCSAMQKANCPMPLFGKENVGFCFTTAGDDPDVVQQERSGANPAHSPQRPQARNE
jgi:hypothetical protein